MSVSLSKILLAASLLLSSSAYAASALEITGQMMPGWNLGNSLDAIGGETNWGNPKTSKAMIDKVRAAGFKTLRVPVSWDDYTSGSSFSIASTRLDRVEEVVSYGLANGMYVIINIHHNNGWEAPTYANQANATSRLTSLWKQIATRFKAYDNHLIFETMNEPRSGDDWWGNDEVSDVVNQLNAAALNAIRATGGNNNSRLVMLPSYVAGPHDQQIDKVKLPADSMVALSVHAYLPFDFAMENPGTDKFTNTANLDDLFSRLNSKFIAKGIAVVMGEWGATNKNNYTERVKHAEYYVKAAAKAKIPVILWDNNAYTAGAEAYGQLNRTNLTWTYPEIITAIMKGASAMASSASSSSSSTSSQASSSLASSASSSVTSSSSSAAASSAAAAISLSATATSDGIALNWALSNVSPSTQQIYRDTDANPSGRTRIASLPSTARSYTDTSATAGSTYYYWIKISANGVTINSNAAAIQTSTSNSSSSSAGSSSSASSAASSSLASTTAPTLSGSGDYPTGFAKCSNAGELCLVSKGTGWVAFGRKGKWVAKYLGTGKSIACSVASFGSDPGGNPNKCAYQK